MIRYAQWLMWLTVSLATPFAHAGTVTYVYTDPQGTPLAEADASGNITARFEYTPYGVPVTSMGAAPDGVGYTGHVNDPETGLVYMQARYYDAEVGRFLSVDPVGPSAGSLFHFNRYNYVNNNPVMNVDPTGMYNCDTKHNKSGCEMIKKAREHMQRARNRYVSRSPQAKAIQQNLDFLGTENDNNVVSISFGYIDGSSNGEAHYDANAGISLTFDLDAMKANFGGLGRGAVIEYAATVLHETQHGVDAVAREGDPVGFKQRYQTEYNAFMAQSYINEAFGVSSPYDVWNVKWPSNFSNAYRRWEADLQAQCATSSSLCVAR